MDGINLIILAGVGILAFITLIVFIKCFFETIYNVGRVICCCKKSRCCQKKENADIEYGSEEDSDTDAVGSTETCLSQLSANVHSRDYVDIAVAEIDKDLPPPYSSLYRQYVEIATVYITKQN